MGLASGLECAPRGGSLLGAPVCAEAKKWALEETPAHFRRLKFLERAGALVLSWELGLHSAVGMARASVAVTQGNGGD